MDAHRAAGPPATRGGGKSRADMRELLNGAMYVLGAAFQ